MRAREFTERQEVEARFGSEGHGLAARTVSRQRKTGVVGGLYRKAFLDCPMSIPSFQIAYWIQNLFVPFVVASVMVLAISGKKQLSKPKVYPIRLGAALVIAIFMGAYLGSPWLGTIMVSAATGLLFRYW